MVWAYSTATSCEQGARLAFRIGRGTGPGAGPGTGSGAGPGTGSGAGPGTGPGTGPGAGPGAGPGTGSGAGPGTEGGTPRGTVRVEDAVDGTLACKDTFDGAEWELPVGADWPSSLYRAVFQPGAAPYNEAYFAVRRAGQDRAPMLLSVPFATWQAYNLAGVPGQSIYWTENPLRASSVSFDRPGGGPAPEQWERGMMRWLRTTDTPVDYCSNLDLHLDPALLDHYRLLLIVGHDEYWTWQMRDAAESFTRRGGNVAIFGANTCWWQMRLADAGRTMICYRDAIADPAAAGRPELATVEWSSAPVCRPENAMTGLSFRLGAGCWGQMSAMREDAYTARFADHWVFDGTGLKDGDKFGRGCLGYETDAAEIDESGGSPRITGRDGTPGSFTVLATADLRHWAAHGQAGAATMGVFTAGGGTVFNAGTVNWGAALSDRIVARITRNVLNRLSGPSWKRPDWVAAGTRAGVRALAASGSTLYAVLEDREILGAREACGQNLPWRPIGDATGIVALASPRDAVPGAPDGIYALHRGGLVLMRPAVPEGAQWTPVGKCPPAPRGLAVANNQFFLLDDDGAIWCLPQGEIGADPAGWTLVERTNRLTALTGLNGRLLAVDDSGRLLGRLPVPGGCWDELGDADGCVALAGHAGALYGASPGRPLRRCRLPARPDL